MKKLLFLAIALSLPFAQVTRAEPDQQKKKPKHHVAAQNANQANGQQGAPSATRPGQPQVHHAVAQHPSRVATPAQPQTGHSQSKVNGATVQSKAATMPVTKPVTQPVTKVTKVTPAVRNSFAVAKSRVIVVRHDRGWWVNRYPNTRFVLFGGGYYYWNSGYWYPAYGYNPIYSTYAYNEPIYGYNNLAPGQVLQNVQVALRGQGYYRGSIDGLVGPQTRDALARYQQDHGLVVTSAVDEPTLVTLGLA